MEIINSIFGANILVVGVELALAIGSCILLLLGAFGISGKYAKSMKKDSMQLIVGLASGLLLVSIFVLLMFMPMGFSFHKAFIMDSFGLVAKILILASSFGSMLLCVAFNNYKNAESFNSPEYPVLLLLATLGMCLMASANDMIVLYLGLELQSLSLYVLAALNRENLKSSEAGLKYFVLGALSSGMLLYGISLIYGFSGHTGFAEIANFVNDDLSSGGLSIGMIFGLVFVLVGIAFKISAVPFHMWTPDVYEGAPTPITAFLASSAKIAGMALLIRLIFSAFGGAKFEWQQVIFFLSLGSMLLGSFAAIYQTNIKRLLAYSSIGHMGFVLMGLAAGNQFAVSSVVTYLIIYTIMTIGIFACIIFMKTNKGAVENIEDISGLFSTNPLVCVMATVLLFSLAGIPPLAGFWAKYFVFSSAIEAGLYPLAIVGVIAGVVAAFYYLRIIKLMWFDESKQKFLPIEPQLKWLLGFCGLFVLFYVFVADYINSVANFAVGSFF